MSTIFNKLNEINNLLYEIRFQSNNYLFKSLIDIQLKINEFLIDYQFLIDSQYDDVSSTQLDNIISVIDGTITNFLQGIANKINSGILSDRAID